MSPVLELEKVPLWKFLSNVGLNEEFNLIGSYKSDGCSDVTPLRWSGVPLHKGCTEISFLTTIGRYKAKNLPQLHACGGDYQRKISRKFCHKKVWNKKNNMYKNTLHAYIIS